MTNHDETCQFGPVTAALTPPFFLPPSHPHSSRSVLKHLSPLASLSSESATHNGRTVPAHCSRTHFSSRNSPSNALNVSNACTLMSRPDSRLISPAMSTPVYSRVLAWARDGGWTSEDEGIGVSQPNSLPTPFRCTHLARALLYISPRLQRLSSIAAFDASALKPPSLPLNFISIDLPTARPPRAVHLCTIPSIVAHWHQDSSRHQDQASQCQDEHRDCVGEAAAEKTTD
ncbi:hypothetical protein C8F01DRAFT_1254141 [Mycena amicta]|nr:hypothetical protein C8F01DRAFT_1254141 [Mycena amicta]